MTREEAINTLKENYCAMCPYGSANMDSCNIRGCDNRDAIKTLEQESNTDYKAFAELVAEEIFDENWDFNKDAFAELACRKLAKLGIVRAKGDEWELVKHEEE